MLNKQQKEAVEQPLDCQLQIVAGPGTGKTNTLTSRVVYLLDNGVKPEELVVLTFTNQAAREMRERVLKMLKTTNRCAEYISNVQRKLVIGTFHSICYKVLRKYAGRILNMESRSVAAEDEKTEYLEAILQKQELSALLAENGFTVEAIRRRSIQISSEKTPTAELKLGELALWISQTKTGARPTTKIQKIANIDEVLQFIYESYVGMLKKNKKYDFDDLMVFCKAMLTADASPVAHIKAVLVDEFQDTDNLQLELTYLFAQVRNNITVVGDPDQSIYAFRGAIPENFKKMRDRFPSCRVVLLEENYRSTKPVLDLASTVIANDPDRIPSKLFSTDDFAVKSDSQPQKLQFHDEAQERDGIERHIHSIIKLSKGALAFKDFAILCRTHRQAKSLASMKSTPVRYLGGREFWERPVINHILNYLRVIYNIEDAVAVKKSINYPKRGLGPQTMNFCFGDNELNELGSSMEMRFETLKERHELGTVKELKGITSATASNVCAYYDFIQSCRADLARENSPTQVVQVIKKTFGLLIGSLIENDIRNSGGALSEEEISAKRLSYEMSVTQLENIFTATADNLRSASADDIELYEELGCLGYLLDTVSLRGEDGKEKETDCVSVGTMHSAKGLEWPFVFASLGSPRHRKSDSEAGAESEVDVEEVRLLFVTVTRAKLGLFLSCAPVYTSSYTSNWGGASSTTAFPSVISAAGNLCVAVYSSFKLYTVDQWQNGFKFLNLRVPTSFELYHECHEQGHQNSLGNENRQNSRKAVSKRGLNVSNLPNAGFSSAASLLTKDDGSMAFNAFNTTKTKKVKVGTKTKTEVKTKREFFR